jgi:hypothetical protein
MAVDLDFSVQLYSVWLVLIPGFTWLMTNLRRLGGFIQVMLVTLRPRALRVAFRYSFSEI